MQSMGSMSVLHWVVVLVFYLIVYLVVGMPVARILRRVGYSGWWSILSVIPLANLIGLWVLAFVGWPIDRPISRGSA
jgi:amino acid transporter